MAATQLYTFEVALSDVDRGVYEQLELKVARHPSETLDYLATRVLAYCLEHAEGISFSKGLFSGDEPAVWVHSLDGQLRAWIEVGWFDAERIHKACKAAPRVAIYTHKDVAQLKTRLSERKIHKGEGVAIYALERRFLDDLVRAIDRRTALDLSVTDRHLYVTVGGKTLECQLIEEKLET